MFVVDGFYIDQYFVVLICKQFDSIVGKIGYEFCCFFVVCRGLICVGFEIYVGIDEWCNLGECF